MPTPNADGPDIAHYQTLTGRPVDPAWRLFSHKCSEGAFSGDVMFPARWAWMRASGFKYRGAYHWLRSDSTVKDQVANLCRRLDALGGLQRGEFVQIDWETTPNIAVPTSLMAAESCDRVEQHYGRACTVTYTGTWLPDSPLDADTRREFLEWRDENPDAPLWLAFYNTTIGGGWAACATYRADMWQWTSSFTHPSIVSPTKQPDGRTILRGFDMNHVSAWSTLDRITDQVPTAPALPVPPLEDDMTFEYLYRHTGYKNVWLCGAGGAQAIDETTRDAAMAAGLKLIENAHEQSLVSAIERSGLRWTDLVPA